MMMMTRKKMIVIPRIYHWPEGPQLRAYAEKEEDHITDYCIG